MRNTGFLAATLLLGLAAPAAAAPPPPAAFALDLDQVAGGWSDAVGAPDTTSYATVGNESQVRWGYDGGFGQSGLGFTPTGSLPRHLIPAEEFELGTLRHFNNPVGAPTVSSVDLDVVLTFHDSAPQPPLAFNFKIIETPNGGPCPFPGNTPCSDKLTFPTALPSQQFTLGGRLMELVIVGFRTQPGGPVLSEFISEERQTNSAILVARIHVLKGGCTYTFGYWKTHAKAWPVGVLFLGQRLYTQKELLAILKQPVRGNGLIALSHQLIAAKLNRANYAATPDAVEAAIGDADGLVGALVVPPVGNGYLPTSLTSDLVDELDHYNQGGWGDPAHCR